jgi:hypothetical protein
MDMPDASSRWICDSVVRAPIAAADHVSPLLSPLLPFLLSLSPLPYFLFLLLSFPFNVILTPGH